MENWPNLFIVGAPKAGTSSLYAYLKEIPDIFMSPIKEPNYFSVSTIPNESNLKPIRDKKKYLDLFQGVTNEKFIGEASPSYLTDPEAPKLIHQINPDARIIISLRDPVERVFSDYLMFLRLGILQSSFHDELKKSLNKIEMNDKPGVRLQHSIYYVNVKRYLDIFHPSQIKILIFEEFAENPKNTLQEILTFLGINYSLDNFSAERFNQFAVPRGKLSKNIYQNRNIRKIAEKLFSPYQRKLLREKLLLKKTSKPKIDLEDKKILIDYYKKDVENLQNILKRKIPWKNFSQ